MLGYGATLMTDTYAVSLKRLPAWWMRLKYPLTGFVLLALALTLAFVPEPHILAQVIAIPAEHAATQAVQ